MGLESILRAIEAELADAITALEAATEVRVAEVISDARTRAEAERAHFSLARNDEADRVFAKIVNRARLESERGMALAREELFQEALERLRAELIAVTASPRYRHVLRALYLEANAILAGDDVTILVRPEDRSLMEQLVDEGRGSVEASLDCIGGLDIEAPDGRAVRNTIDSRLTTATRQLRHLAASLVPELRRGA